MHLKKFMQRKELSTADVAQALGVTMFSVQRYLNAGRIPDPRIIVEIWKLSDGAVTPNDWFPEVSQAENARKSAGRQKKAA